LISRRGGFCLLAGVMCTSCGGSSSETPPPQQPDSWQMIMRRPVAPAASTNAGSKPSQRAWGTYGKSESTWGSGKPKAVPAPAGGDAGVPGEPGVSDELEGL
jgi:hypothetical protein